MKSSEATESDNTSRGNHADVTYLRAMRRGAKIHCAAWSRDAVSMYPRRNCRIKSVMKTKSTMRLRINHGNHGYRLGGKNATS